MTTSPVVVLDIGASKVLCLVGEIQEEEGKKLKILGLGSSPCHGLRRSTVVDLPKVVDSIREAVCEAEHSAGLKITGAYIGLAGQSISAHTNRIAVAISGMSNPIVEEDIERALAAAERMAPATSALLHRFIQSYAIDGETVQNPLWLHGNKLEVETLSIIASSHLCSTLERAAAEAEIEIAGFVFETVALASGLLPPNADEYQMGIGILDIGAGSSDLAVFRGTLRHVVEIPFGGSDITRDISFVLNMSLREAEQLKLEFGCVRSTGEEADQEVPYRTIKGQPLTISRQQLGAIIEARQQEIFEFICRELENHISLQDLEAGFILSGGGALLKNVTLLGEEILGTSVRLGTPRDLIASESLYDPRYATAIGLLHYITDENTHDECIVKPLPSQDRLRDKITKLFSFF